MNLRAFIRGLALDSAILLAATIVTFGHSTIVPVGLTISKAGVQPGYLIFGAPDGHAYAIDIKGNVAKKWSAPEPGSELQYELPHEVRAQIMEGYPSGQRTGLPAPAATRGFDYLHMNAASPIPESAGHTDPRFKPGNVIVSYRYINTLAVVDRDTKKIVWKTVGLTIGQHNPHFVPGGLPGTGNG